MDILSNVRIDEILQAGEEHDATLLVSNRQTSRYLLFDEDMRLVGWTNIDTGEVRSPYAGIDPDCCTRLAFAGIHCISPDIFPLMRDWPEKFGIVDFYLSVCRTHAIRAAVMPGLVLHDVGKVSELSLLDKLNF